MVKGMTLQASYENKDDANKSLSGYRSIGFTGKIIKSPNGNYLVYIGSFGARYKKLKANR